MKIDKKIPTYLQRANKGGLFIGFIYVLVFMSILFLWIWQTFESEDNKSSMNFMDERIAIIEEQINIVDETNNDTITDISSSIQFLDKEIRKLWDLSNKRNKVNIQKLSEQTIKIEQLLKSLEDEVSYNQSTIINMKDAIDQNISNIQELGMSADDLSIIRLNLSSIDTQLMLLDDTVQALNSYKNQLNQTILEIQTQINTTQSQRMSDEEEN